jgi:hypothetical protein
MTIQNCVVEVLDTIFECNPYSDPENAQATLRSLMLTCSYFRAIAKRRLLCIVYLSNAERSTHLLVTSDKWWVFLQEMDGPDEECGKDGNKKFSLGRRVRQLHMVVLSLR